MSYIGNTAQNQSYAPGIDYFSGDGSTVAFTLTRPVNVAAQMLVFVANVPQNPSTAFTVSGNTLTFTSAPPAGTNNIWVEYTSLITNLMVPGQGTVNANSLAPNTLTPAGVSGQANTATSYLDLPKGTTAQRPASPQPGNMRYNTTLNVTEIYSGIAWTGITSQSYSVDYLLVAGAGGGGAGWAGGGGAGGLLTNSITLIPSTTYSFVVGAGGAGVTGSPTAPNQAAQGSNSTAFGLTAIGGGGGGGYSNAGGNGGSGGGSSNASTSYSGGAGTTGQGNAGGTGYSTTYYGAGGGGGSGAVGASGNSSAGGNGGVGTASGITGSSVYYAGGGGGSIWTNAGTTSGGSGGSGGGGAGGNSNQNGTNGTANTGGGGGGGGFQAGTYNGGNGGSGIVILSIPTSKYTGTYSGSPVISTSGANTILQFTASGSYTA